MKTTFKCPHCQGVINPREYLILIIEYKSKRGLILLSPNPGDYHSIWDESFDQHVVRGEPVDFYCPICDAGLQTPASDKLVELDMITPGEKDGKALFSRILGEHATFVLDGDQIIPYGRDANRFENLNFSEGDSWW